MKETVEQRTNKTQEEMKAKIAKLQKEVIQLKSSVK